MWSKTTRGIENPSVHNSGGRQAWIDEHYGNLIKHGAKNDYKYTNIYSEQDFSYTHPLTGEKRERSKPLVGILTPPSEGRVTCPKTLKETATAVLNERNKYYAKMTASGNNEMSLDRIMFFCTSGAIFSSKMIYVMAVLADRELKFTSKRHSAGISSGVTLASEHLEVPSDISTPSADSPACDSHSNKANKKPKRKDAGEVTSVPL